MCVVLDVDNCEKSVNIVLKDGTIIKSDWFNDDFEAVEDAINCTVAEKETYEKILIQNDLTEDMVEKWYITRKKEDENYYISNHATERIKERLGWNKNTSLRMIKKVIDNGTKIEDIDNYLKFWGKRKLQTASENETIYIYGSHAFVFRGNMLVTVYPVPNKAKVKRVIFNNKCCFEDMN